jgi:2-polyprenyl-3-methyl-5-hydroxy-6-metoxy-1,4-benzoquinol methylase
MQTSFPRRQAETPCAACGSTDIFLVSTQCRYGEPLKTVLCTGCSLGRRDPMPAEADLEAYYHRGYRIELGKGRRPPRRRLLGIADVAVSRAADLLPRISAGAKTIDIGCGAGELIYMLTAAGCDSSGFDPDSDYIDWARTVIGPGVSRGNIQDVAVEPGSVDLVTMFHVLEHLRDPRVVFTRCASWLKPDGLLVVEVPNFGSTVQGPGHIFQKGHLHYYTLRSLCAVAARVGLHCEDGGTFNRGENLRCYFRKSAADMRQVSTLDENLAHILKTLEQHRPLTHYLSFTPYYRTWKRLRRTLVEVCATAGKTDTQILAQSAKTLSTRFDDTRMSHLRDNSVTSNPPGMAARARR